MSLQGQAVPSLDSSYPSSCHTCIISLLLLLSFEFRYKLRLLFDAVDMRWDWPVDANYHEAKAYCSWRAERDGSEVAYRIVSEAAHMLLRRWEGQGDKGERVGGGGGK